MMRMFLFFHFETCDQDLLDLYIFAFWLYVSSGYGTKTVQRAWEVSRSANEKPHPDLAVFASHLH